MLGKGLLPLHAPPSRKLRFVVTRPPALESEWVCFIHFLPLIKSLGSQKVPYSAHVSFLCASVDQKKLVMSHSCTCSSPWLLPWCLPRTSMYFPFFFYFPEQIGKHSFFETIWFLLKEPRLGFLTSLSCCWKPSVKDKHGGWIEYRASANAVPQAVALCVLCDSPLLLSTFALVHRGVFSGLSTGWLNAATLVTFWKYFSSNLLSVWGLSMKAYARSGKIPSEFCTTQSPWNWD